MGMPSPVIVCTKLGCVTPVRRSRTLCPSRCVKLRSKPSSACQVSCHDINAMRKKKTDLIDADRFFPVQTRFFTSPSTLFFLALDAYYDVTSIPVRRLVRFALKYDIMVFGHTRYDFKGIRLKMVDNLGTSTMGTDPLDYSAVAMAIRACHLTLSIHSREYLLLNDFNT